MIAYLLGFVRQVVRINAYAVSPDEAGIEFQEVPFRSGGFKHRLCIYPHFVEDYRELVHERDIDVPLAVFNDLSRFSNFDGRGTMDSGFYYELVYFRYRVKCLVVHARYYFCDSLEAVDFVTWVDAFWGICDFEIFAAFQTGFFFKNRGAYFFGNSGIYGRLKYHY